MRGAVRFLVPSAAAQRSGAEVLLTAPRGRELPGSHRAQQVAGLSRGRNHRARNLRGLPAQTDPSRRRRRCLCRKEPLVEPSALLSPSRLSPWAAAAFVPDGPRPSPPARLRAAPPRGARRPQSCAGRREARGTARAPRPPGGRP